MLYVFPELGVFAKKAIPKMTQFGPLVGELVDSVDRITNRNFVLIVSVFHLLHSL